AVGVQAEAQVQAVGVPVQAPVPVQAVGVQAEAQVQVPLEAQVVATPCQRLELGDPWLSFVFSAPSSPSTLTRPNYHTGDPALQGLPVQVWARVLLVEVQAPVLVLALALVPLEGQAAISCQVQE